MLVVADAEWLPPQAPRIAPTVIQLTPNRNRTRSRVQPADDASSPSQIIAPITVELTEVHGSGSNVKRAAMLLGSTALRGPQGRHRRTVRPNRIHTLEGVMGGVRPYGECPLTRSCLAPGYRNEAGPNGCLKCGQLLRVKVNGLLLGFVAGTPRLILLVVAVEPLMLN